VRFLKLPRLRQTPRRMMLEKDAGNEGEDFRRNLLTLHLLYQRPVDEPS
jgi:hypothetical protein